MLFSSIGEISLYPNHETTINLAPADMRKEGASFDLPIALSILGANGDLGETPDHAETLRSENSLWTGACGRSAARCP